MIKLSNVSKFYYKKGMIASGFTRVNLELNLGEFVVITGESGSGKSTLLNVISGLDTYEEGEMYIDGKETSHFMDKDFVEYRKRYIGNIFQSFNLVNSYTVYQNVELILLINGYKKSEIKKRTREILDKVGMLEFAHTKASKLSGGQKQRVAIARALAKNTDIIVADEPTGNLDSKSAQDIVKLLSDIANDKLVIVVTHNYEQFEGYATRKIKMHDGKISEDIKLKDVKFSETTRELGSRSKRAGRNAGKLSAGSKLRLGVRNTFNVLPKFLLLLLVFVFVLAGVTSEYTAYLSQKHQADNLGYNSYFTNASLNRVILKKSDGSKFTTSDYESINKIYNVKNISEYDILLDNELALESGDIYYDVIPRSVDEYKGSLVSGRMPSASNEVLAVFGNTSGVSKRTQKNSLNKTFQVTLGESGKTANVTVVGIAEDKNDNSLASYNAQIYMQDNMLDEIMTEIYHTNSTITVTINGKEQTVEDGDTMYNLIPNSKVKKGEALVSSEVNNFYDDGKSEGHKLKGKVTNIYYKSEKTFKITKTYTEATFKKLTGLKSYESNAGAVFINPSDYNKMFSHNNYQSTIYVKDTDKIKDTKTTLEKMGYEVLPIQEVLITNIGETISLLQLPITIIVIITLFFVAYFVIRLILKSRTGYFSILRMLGMQQNAIRRVMDIEIITVVIIAFAIFMAAAMLSSHGIISVKYINNLIKYMTPENYGILFAINLVMGYLISGKFTRSLFKGSAMGTYREVE